MLGPLLVSTSMRVIVLSASLAALLSACATSYTPTTRPDAAKLRVRLLNPGSGMQLTAFLRPLGADRTCGEPVRAPMMFPYFGPPAQTREFTKACGGLLVASSCI